MVDESMTVEADIWMKNGATQNSFKTGRDIFTAWLEFIFDFLQARKIIIGISIKVRHSCWYFKRIGFAQEGILREAIFYDGKPEDIAVFGMLRKEF